MNSKLSKEKFDELLAWFSQNEDEAGEVYEQIRSGLLRFFRYRGCSDPHSLADETMNRVATKLSSLDLSTGVKKISIFYGFAFNIYREYLSGVSKKELQLEPAYYVADENPSSVLDEENGDANPRTRCFDKCLENANPEDRDLLIRYYSKEKGEKLRLRRQLAEDLGIRANTLHVKVHRLRNRLKECIEKCIEDSGV